MESNVILHGHLVTKANMHALRHFLIRPQFDGEYFELFQLKILSKS